MIKSLLPFAALLFAATVNAQEADIEGSAGFDARLWTPVIKAFFLEGTESASDGGSPVGSELRHTLTAEDADLDMYIAWDAMNELVAMKPEGYQPDESVFSGWGPRTRELDGEQVFIGFWRHRHDSVPEEGGDPPGIAIHYAALPLELRVQPDIILTGTGAAERSFLLNSDLLFRVVDFDVGIYLVSRDLSDFTGKVNCNPAATEPTFSSPDDPCHKVYAWPRTDDPFLVGDRTSLPLFLDKVGANIDDEIILSLPHAALEPGVYEARVTYGVLGRFQPADDSEFPGEKKTINAAIRFGITKLPFDVQRLEVR